MLQLFNTLTRQIEKFKPRGKIVSLYTCGPTVYHDVHLGNYRTFLTGDLLKRALLANGFSVKQVMNITDVGHLTTDADTGEDKMEVGAAREKKSVRQIAARYTKIFKREARELNILAPDILAPASKHIKEQISLVRVLEKKGFTYRTADGIYFASRKFKKYGALTGFKKQKLLAGARVAMGEKKSPTDFALWKFSPTDKKRQLEWPSPWGVGFPGWHVECAAMAIKYLGATIDLHVGGIDLVPVHHTNEIAEAEATTGKQFVRYWVHSAFVVAGGKKLSKSTGEFKTLTWLKKRGWSPADYRYLTLQTHYRKELHFSEEAVVAARTARVQIVDVVANAVAGGMVIPAVYQAALAAINDDLNFPEALGEVWKMMSAVYNDADKRATLLALDKIFGLGLAAIKPLKIPAAIKKLVAARERARQEKNWSKSDRLRLVIAAQGFAVRDTTAGQIIRRQI